MRTLFFILFLIISALIVMAWFAKKSQPIQDAKSYTELNPTCAEIKIHSQKTDIVECFANFELDYKHSLPIVKLLAERSPQEFPLRMRYILSVANNSIDSMQISGTNLNLIKNKNSKWINTENDCEYFSDCLANPLRDSSVYAVLSGKVLQVTDDFLLIYHGKNIYSKIKNITFLKEIKKGDIISPDSSLGFPTDSTIVEITKNGKRIGQK